MRDVLCAFLGGWLFNPRTAVGSQRSRWLGLLCGDLSNLVCLALIFLEFWSFGVLVFFSLVYIKKKKKNTALSGGF